MRQYFKVGNTYKLMSAPDDNLHDLKSYKIAKMYLEHYEAILTVIKASIRGFEIFSAHQSAQECLYTLRAQNAIVQGRINKCKNIIASKGKK